jgi:hypothetical protein
LQNGGLGEQWENYVRSIWEGRLGSHNINDGYNNLPEAIIRLMLPSWKMVETGPSSAWTWPGRSIVCSRCEISQPTILPFKADQASWNCIHQEQSRMARPTESAESANTNMKLTTVALHWNIALSQRRT